MSFKNLISVVQSRAETAQRFVGCALVEVNAITTGVVVAVAVGSIAGVANAAEAVINTAESTLVGFKEGYRASKTMAYERSIKGECTPC